MASVTFRVRGGLGKKREEMQRTPDPIWACFLGLGQGRLAWLNKRIGVL